VRSGRSSKSNAQVQVEFAFTNARGEGDSFALCEHWNELLHHALLNVKENKPVIWTSDFNCLHYAVSKCLRCSLYGRSRFF
jgi:hypothetical protein